MYRSGGSRYIRTREPFNFRRYIYARAVAAMYISRACVPADKISKRARDMIRV